jgi:hypothetical protein
MPNSLSGPNAIAPERMTSEERLAEVGRLLAAGILRLRAGDIRLDFPLKESGVGREHFSGLETRDAKPNKIKGRPAASRR